jgi:SAM-dependent methyltransferase
VLAVLQTLLKVQGQVVLHLAPEGCIYDFLSEGNQVIAGDRDPLSYRQIASDLACLDAVRLPFTEGTFGLVVANHVLEHIPDDREVMKELFRVLKRGGAAILQVPIGLRLGAILESLEALSDDERIDRFGQKDHVRIYSLQGIRERLELAGFRVRVYQQSELGIMENLSLQANEVLISAVKP